ncbi:MAG: cytochrome P450 [Chloroflexota bacterium]
MTQHSIEAERKYDLYSPEAKRDIYDTYGSMRDNDPILKQIGIDGKSPIWWISKYKDVSRILKDNKTFVRDWRIVFPPDPSEQNNGIWSLIDDHMLSKDGADHRRLRILVSKAFMPRIINELRPRIQQIADELLEAVGTDGEMDLVAEYAFPLPTIVISELLGIPAEDRDRFKVWTNAVLTPNFDPASAQESMKHIQDFIAYLGHLFEKRRQQPQDDFVTNLLQAEDDGDRLTEAELYSMMFLLIVAGHETTVNLIGNAMKALFYHPEQLAALKANPTLIDTAVEEFLRFDGSVERALARWTTTDVEIDGHLIPKGSTVIAILGSANRDGEMFDEAETFDIARKATPHLAFGKGAHYCLGAPLARLETAVAINTLLARCPNIQPNVPLDSLTWRNIPGFRGLKTFPVKWDRS